MTTREQVLKLKEEGMSNSEIMATLHITYPQLRQILDGGEDNEL